MTDPQPHQHASSAARAPADDADNAQDVALVDRIRRGDTSAWSELILRYQDRLYTVCVRMVRDRDLASDLTQDAFIKIIQGIDGFDGRSKLSTWVIRITMNVCLSKLRSEKLRRHASLEAMAQAGRGGEDRAGVEVPPGASLGTTGRTSREPGAGLSVQEREERALLADALARLEPEQRAILILSDCHGLAYEHIAGTMGLALGTVKSRIFRARAALRDMMEHVERQRSGTRAS